MINMILTYCKANIHFASVYNSIRQ